MVADPESQIRFQVRGIAVTFDSSESLWLCTHRDKACDELLQGRSRIEVALVSASRAELSKARDRATGWKTSALRALRSYDAAIPCTATQKEQEGFAQQLLTGQTILELDALSYSTKKFLIPLLCLWLYSVQLGRH